MIIFTIPIYYQMLPEDIFYYIMDFLKYKCHTCQKSIYNLDFYCIQGRYQYCSEECYHFC